MKWKRSGVLQVPFTIFNYLTNVFVIIFVFLHSNLILPFREEWLYMVESFTIYLLLNALYELFVYEQCIMINMFNMNYVWFEVMRFLSTICSSWLTMFLIFTLGCIIFTISNGSEILDSVFVFSLSSTILDLLPTHTLDLILIYCFQFLLV